MDMEVLLHEALSEYEFENPQVTFIRHNENITYMIQDNGNKYVLRISKPVDGFHTDIFRSEYTAYERMEDEIKVINHVRMNSEFKLQRPIRNIRGELVTILSSGYPACVLEWIEGSIINEKSVTEEDAKSLGIMVAQLQKVLRGLEVNLKRLKYTGNLISFMKDELAEAIYKEHLLESQGNQMMKALDVIGERMHELDRIPEAYGMIHADLGLSNIIVSNEGFVPIDFSLSGYGFYYMEVAMLMSNLSDKKIRSIVKVGYEEVIGHEVPICYIDAFFAFGVLLYICSQHEKGFKEDWFSGAINRWCNTIFTPLMNGEQYVL